MLEINPKDLSTKDLHGYLLSSVGPRPIALVSTIDNEGRPNLSPFSFLLNMKIKRLPDHYAFTAKIRCMEGIGEHLKILIICILNAAIIKV